MFVGRAAELAALDVVLRSATLGAGSAVTVVGDPGIGKTTLVEQSLTALDDVTIVRCAGIEAEGALSFGGLIALLRPLIGLADHLVPVRRDALRSALRVAGPSGADRLTVFEAAVDLVVEAAATRPLIIVADDIHWLDENTRDCLAYISRRIEHCAVALIAISRALPVVGVGSLRTSEIELGPLNHTDALEVLRCRWGSLAVRTERVVLDTARGNPLALVELPKMMSVSQRSGEFDTSPLRIAPRLQEGYAHRIVALPVETRELLVMLSVTRATISETLAAARATPHCPHDLEPALAESLMVARDGTISFAHPLIRHAVTSMASPGQLRRAHMMLAEVLDDPAATWHCAACATGPDAAVAARLAATGFDALSRSSPDDAALAFGLAGDLSSTDDVRAIHWLAAGRAAFTAGDAHRAFVMLDRAAGASTGDRRAEAEHLAGLTAAWFVNARDGHRRLSAAAERADISDEWRVRMLADAALAATAWSCPDALDLADRAWAIAHHTDAATRVVAGTTLMWCSTLSGHARTATALWNDVHPLLGSVRLDSPDAHSMLFALNWRVESEEYAEAMTMARTIATVSADVGASAARAGPLVVAGDSARRLGEWDVAEECLLEATEVATETRQIGAQAMATAALCRLLAARGDDSGCRDAVAMLARLSDVLGLESGAVFGGAAIGLLELGLGRIAPAVIALERTHADARRIGLADPLFVPYLPDLIEAHVLLKDLGRARELLGELATLSAGTDAAGARAALARCEGLVDGDPAATARARVHHDASGMPFETARTLLVHGELLRRDRKKAAARGALTEAQTIFVRLGATAWAQRARREITALDGHPEAMLTGQQREIAMAVAGGARNREIAAELFLSVKTVERHLSAIYRIAGVRSRVELSHWLTATDRHRGADAGGTRRIEP